MVELAALKERDAELQQVPDAGDRIYNTLEDAIKYYRTGLKWCPLKKSKVQSTQWYRQNVPCDDDGEPHIAPGGAGRVVDDVWLVQRSHGPCKHQP